MPKDDPGPSLPASLQEVEIRHIPLDLKPVTTRSEWWGLEDEASQTGPENCDEPYPPLESLRCSKPPDHDGDHATCLGYHPEPYNVYEWAQWSSRDKESG